MSFLIFRFRRKIESQFLFISSLIYGVGIEDCGQHTLDPEFMGVLYPGISAQVQEQYLRKHLNPLVKGKSSSIYAGSRGGVVDGLWTDPFPSFIRLPW